MLAAGEGGLVINISSIRRCDRDGQQRRLLRIEARSIR